MSGYIFMLDEIITRLGQMAQAPCMGEKTTFVCIGLSPLREGQVNGVDCSGVELPMTFSKQHDNIAIGIRLQTLPRKLHLMLPENVPLYRVTQGGVTALRSEGTVITDGVCCWYLIESDATKRKEIFDQLEHSRSLSGTVKRKMQVICLESDHPKSEWILIKSD